MTKKKVSSGPPRNFSLQQNEHFFLLFQEKKNARNVDKSRREKRAGGKERKKPGGEKGTHKKSETKNPISSCFFQLSVLIFAVCCGVHERRKEKR